MQWFDVHDTKPESIVAILDRPQCRGAKPKAFDEFRVPDEVSVRKVATVSRANKRGGIMVGYAI